MKIFRKTVILSAIISLAVCLSLGFSNTALALRPSSGKQIQELAKLIANAEALGLPINTLLDFGTIQQKIVEPVFNPLQKFVGEINSASLLSKIDFSHTDSLTERPVQIKLLLQEVNKELAKPGTGNLPKIALISDYHGGVVRFAQLLSDILREFSGFKGQLDPAVSIEKQLNAQGLSLKTMNGAIYLNGDLLDRGKSGLACFNIAKELSETAPDKVFYISGNHDLWAYLNSSGFHLPWYKKFKLYGDREAENLIAQKRTSNPELFESRAALLWWTERLAEYNTDQEEFQKKALNGKAADIRKKFIESYQKYTTDKKWDSAQLGAMENFIGHFARIDVPDPYVGLNGLGKTSVSWWKSLQQQLIKGKEARSNLGADAGELIVWNEAIALAEAIAPEVESRLKTALDQDKWYYRIFESINNQAYISLEWWAKDWSSHKDWGEAVIKELNAMIKDSNNNDPLIVKDREEFKGQEVTQANYMRSHKLQDLAAFYKNKFNLGIRSPYSDLVTHSVLPIENDEVVITYKNKTYKGEAIFEVLKLISTEIKEAKDPSLAWDALNLVNSWYADMTTIAKPKNEKDLLKKIAPVLSKLGVRIWAKGHNPVNKLKVPVISKDSKDSSFAIVQLDFGMAPKFGGAGGVVFLGPNGIELRGFETEKTDENIKVSPDTIIPAKKEGDQPTVIKNPGMSAKEYLENIKAALAEELARLQLKSFAPVSPSKPVKAENARAFYENIKKQGNVIVMSTNTRSKYVLEGIFLGAKEANAPVIIQRSISEFVQGYTPADLARDAQAAVDAVGYTGDWLLKLDHGTILEDNEAAIQKVIGYVNAAKAAGFASFSIDASKLVNYEAGTVAEQQKRNIEVTAQIVKATGVENFAWEGEIGEIVGEHNSLSSVEEAVTFIEGIEKLGVRAPILLAINNGSEHGNVPGMKINLETTKAIADAIYQRWGIWINQHGITGTELALFPQLAAVRIRNGNVGTHWQNYMWEAINQRRPDIVAKALEALKLDKYRSKDWDKKIRNFEPQLDGLLDTDTKAAITEAVRKTALEHFNAFASKSPSLVAEQVFNRAVIVDSGLLPVGGVTEILKAFAQLNDAYVVFYGPAAKAMGILSGEGTNIITFENEVQAVAKLKEMGIASDKIQLVATELKKEFEGTGIKQKIVSSDTASVLLGLTKAITEINDSSKTRNIFTDLYDGLVKADVIVKNEVSRKSVLDVAAKDAEIVNVESNVKIAEQDAKIIKEVATRVGV